MAPTSAPKKKPRLDPLTSSSITAKGTKKRAKYTERQVRRESEPEDQFVNEKLSKRILEQARDQMDELRREDRLEAWAEGQSDDEQNAYGRSSGLSANLAHLEGGNTSDEEEGRDFDQAVVDDFDIDDEVEAEMQELSREDLDALDMFMPERMPERRNLSDIIMAKFKEQAMQEEAGGADEIAFVPPGLTPKVVEVYTKYVRIVGVALF